MRRAIPLLMVFLGSLLIASGSPAATLNSKNSVNYKFYSSSNEQFVGMNCGGVAIVTKSLPAGSRNVKVSSPTVGARSVDGGVQITAITVVENVVTMTALGDGASICDPLQSGYEPGQAFSWQATFGFEADYQRREKTLIRIYYESYSFGTKLKHRPRTMYDSRAGTPSDQRTRITGIRWKSFGGKKAVGNGKLHLDWCPKGSKCPGNGGRVRLIASKAGYCKSTGAFEYLNLNLYYLGRLQSGSPIDCS